MSELKLRPPNHNLRDGLALLRSSIWKLSKWKSRSLIPRQISRLPRRSRRQQRAVANSISQPGCRLLVDGGVGDAGQEVAAAVGDLGAKERIAIRLTHLAKRFAHGAGPLVHAIGIGITDDHAAQR